MIGVPIVNPRDSIIANLNQQLDQYFGAGHAVQEIPSGVSGEKVAGFGCAHSSKLRTERDKLAPRLKELAESGITVIEAAKQMGIETKRARVIAAENSIKFQAPQ
ncbi:hypothetical protein [Pseudomonas prosekii]|uniref:Uncharacterized protein n=1 Tax=Pseudomonas prosekii TaxID=1148509 RepID=A0A1H1S6A0_9PSED|nr:hypothetical protein [Pseudomonas prosekii]SDS43514.1 hypothetical protein SAMN05216222_1447 [Pseudomonas prosekii]